ncbi:glutamate receptor-like [Crassostrea virginica]
MSFCAQLEDDVIGIIGVCEKCALATIQSYSDTFQVPFLLISSAPIPDDVTSDSYQFFLTPVFIQGLLDIVINKEWQRVFYIYDTDEGLLRLQHILNILNAQKTPQLDIIFLRIPHAEACYEKILQFYNHDTADLRILLDLPMMEIQTTIELLTKTPQIMMQRFHFLLTRLGISQLNESIILKGANFTGFKLWPKSLMKERQWFKTFNTSKMNPTHALLRDALTFFNSTYITASNKFRQKSANDQKLSCRHNNKTVTLSRNRREFTEELRKISINGFSGTIKFDEFGRRKNFELQVIETFMDEELAKDGEWSDMPIKGNRLRIHKSEHTRQPTRKIETPQDIKINITTILEEPYVMIKPEYDALVEKLQGNGSRVCGTHLFQGFCIDLAQKVAEKINMTYDICLVQDGLYGSELPNKSWNGIIGELLDKKAHMAVAPVTITSDRERVVDFTKPFLSLGISIMIKKPADKAAHIFSFMEPLSSEIWMCILFAYVGVSVVLFLVSRFSPAEWKVDSTNITNDFTISNSLWYALGAFMQQGCDISPSAVSGRLVGSVWWFFTLIIISSYTANLAAFLTVDRMNTPINSVEDLAKQTKIQYGTLKEGATFSFFNKSRFALYERMFAYMNSVPDVFVKSSDQGKQKVRNSKGFYAFLMESTTIEYTNLRLPCDTMKIGSNLDSKGYGIATPPNSILKDSLTLAVLALRESGELAQIKKAWFDNMSQCPPESSDDGSQASLKLRNVAGIFYILSCGLIMSTVVAAVEFLYKTIVDSRKSKTSFGSMLKCKARLSFRGSVDSSSGQTTPIKKNNSATTEAVSHKIVALFDANTDKELRIFRQSIINDDFYDLQVNFNDSLGVRRAVNEEVRKNNWLLGVIAVTRTCHLPTLQSYVDHHNLAFLFIGPTCSLKSELKNGSFHIFTKPALAGALVDVMSHKEWEKVYYIYMSDEGILDYEQLLHEIHIQELNFDVVVLRVDSIDQCYRRLTKIYNDDHGNIRVLLNMEPEDSQAVISRLKDDASVNNFRFHFLLSKFGMYSMNGSIHSQGVNITGFRLDVDNNRTDSQVLMRDTMEFVREVLAKYRDSLVLVSREDTREKRSELKGALTKMKYTGSSGPFIFDEDGIRINFTLRLFETLVTRHIAQIGRWMHYNDMGARLDMLNNSQIKSPKQPKEKIEIKVSPNQERIITTIDDQPYVFIKDEYEEEVQQMKSENKRVCGNHYFKGFCIDLAQKVTEILNITNYTICIVQDGKYGSIQANQTWDGMIGELMQKKADMAVAPITISSTRERVVDFTKPYMSLGISIMIKKPANEGAHIFSFMDPLSSEIWMCILFAYVGVSVVLFLVSRFSPSEWKVDEKNISNDFTISNSLWYSLGAFMQQGCDISPKAISGRIVGSVWWFFTLIIISSYTANLAAFLTVDRMNTPISSVEDLAKQTKIQYGCLKEGATYEFFKASTSENSNS